LQPTDNPRIICNLLEKFAQKAQPTYDLIANKIENEKVVGSDEILLYS